MMEHKFHANEANSLFDFHRSATGTVEHPRRSSLPSSVHSRQRGTTMRKMLTHTCITLLLLLALLTAHVHAQNSSSSSTATDQSSSSSSTADSSSSTASTNSSSTAAASSTASSTAPYQPAACVALPLTSVCAPFYAPGQMVSIDPIPCVEEAEKLLLAAPIIWTALSSLTLPGSSCPHDIAQLMCLTVYRPCQSFVSRSLCESTLGTINMTTYLPIPGTCPVEIVYGFLNVVIPGFTTLYNCATNPLFQPAPLGQGPFIVSPDPLKPITAYPHDECQPLKKTSACAGVVDYDVYVPWQYGNNQDLIELGVGNSLRSAFMVASVGNGCLTSIAKALCSIVYMKCSKTVLSDSILASPLSAYFDVPTKMMISALQIPFPELPCRSQCTEVHERCAEMLQENTSDLLAAALNCTGSGAILAPQKTCGGVPQPETAGENFPLLFTPLGVIPFGNGTFIPITSPCNMFNTSQYTQDELTARAQSVIVCPPPLVWSHSIDDEKAILGGSCAVPCPSLMFTRDEWDISDRMYITFCILSFISTIWLWLTWAVFPSKRKQTHTLMFATCMLLFSLVSVITIISTGGRPSRITCENDSQIIHQSHGGTCILQSVAFMYLSLAGFLFWAVSAVDLFIKIVLSKKIGPNERTILNRIYLTVGWGVPLIFLIIALSYESFGGGTAVLPWCQFDSNTPYWLDWLTYYYPLLIILVTGVLCMCCIMITIAKSAYASGMSNRKGWAYAQIRPFLFISIFVFIFSFVFGFRVSLYEHEQLYIDSALEFVVCLSTEFTDEAREAKCGVKPKHTVDKLTWICIQIAIAGQGLFAALIFGSQRINFTLWYGLLVGRGVNHRIRSSMTSDHTKHDKSMHSHTSKDSSRGFGTTTRNTGTNVSRHGSRADGRPNYGNSQPESPYRGNAHRGLGVDVSRNGDGIELSTTSGQRSPYFTGPSSPSNAKGSRGAESAILKAGDSPSQQPRTSALHAAPSPRRTTMHRPMSPSMAFRAMPPSSVIIPSDADPVNGVYSMQVSPMPDMQEEDIENDTEDSKGNAQIMHDTTNFTVGMIGVDGNASPISPSPHSVNTDVTTPVSPYSDEAELLSPVPASSSPESPVENVAVSEQQIHVVAEPVAEAVPQQVAPQAEVHDEQVLIVLDGQDQLQQQQSNGEKSS